MSEYNDDAWDEYLSTGIDPTDGDLGTDEDDDPSVSYATVCPVENVSTSNNRADNYAAPFLRFFLEAFTTCLFRGEQRSRRRPVVTHDLVNGRGRREPEG